MEIEHSFSSEEFHIREIPISCYPMERSCSAERFRGRGVNFCEDERRFIERRERESRERAVKQRIQTHRADYDASRRCIAPILQETTCYRGMEGFGGSTQSRCDSRSRAHSRESVSRIQESYRIAEEERRRIEDENRIRICLEEEETRRIEMERRETERRRCEENRRRLIESERIARECEIEAERRRIEREEEIRLRECRQREETRRMECLRIAEQERRLVEEDQRRRLEAERIERCRVQEELRIREETERRIREQQILEEEAYARERAEYERREALRISEMRRREEEYRIKMEEYEEMKRIEAIERCQIEEEYERKLREYEEKRRLYAEEQKRQQANAEYEAHISYLETLAREEEFIKQKEIALKHDVETEIDRKITQIEGTKKERIQILKEQIEREVSLEFSDRERQLKDEENALKKRIDVYLNEEMRSVVKKAKDIKYSSMANLSTVCHAPPPCPPSPPVFPTCNLIPPLPPRSLSPIPVPRIPKRARSCSPYRRTPCLPLRPLSPTVSAVCLNERNTSRRDLSECSLRSENRYRSTDDICRRIGSKNNIRSESRQSRYSNRNLSREREYSSERRSHSRSECNRLQNCDSPIGSVQTQHHGLFKKITKICTKKTTFLEPVGNYSTVLETVPVLTQYRRCGSADSFASFNVCESERERSEWRESENQCSESQRLSRRDEYSQLLADSANCRTAQATNYNCGSRAASCEEGMAASRGVHFDSNGGYRTGSVTLGSVHNIPVGHSVVDCQSGSSSKVFYSSAANSACQNGYFGNVNSSTAFNQGNSSCESASARDLRSSSYNRAIGKKEKVVTIPGKRSDEACASSSSATQIRQSEASFLSKSGECEQQKTPKVHRTYGSMTLFGPAVDQLKNVKVVGRLDVKEKKSEEKSQNPLAPQPPKEQKK